MPDFLLRPVMSIPGNKVCVFVSCVSDHCYTTLDALALQMLAENELVRAASIVVASVRRAYVLAHTLKRIVLSCVVDESLLPNKLVFERDFLGKAYIPGTGLHFNLSHSGAYVALAFSHNGPIGVDVEIRCPYKKYEHAAAASLCDEEVAQVQESSDPALAFLRRWTSKEAYVKATGEGLRKSFKDLRVQCSETDCMVSGANVQGCQTFSYVAKEYVLCACSLASRKQQFLVRRVCLSTKGKLLLGESIGHRLPSAP